MSYTLGAANTLRGYYILKKDLISDTVSVITNSV